MPTHQPWITWHPAAQLRATGVCCSSALVTATDGAWLVNRVGTAALVPTRPWTTWD